MADLCWSYLAPQIRSQSLWVAHFTTVRTRNVLKRVSSYLDGMFGKLAASPVLLSHEGNFDTAFDPTRGEAFPPDMLIYVTDE